MSEERQYEAFKAERHEVSAKAAGHFVFAEPSVETAGETDCDQRYQPIILCIAAVERQYQLMTATLPSSHTQVHRSEIILIGVRRESCIV